MKSALVTGTTFPPDRRSDHPRFSGGDDRRSQGAPQIARRFIDEGKPVFPVPFTGGESTQVFQDILGTWCDALVPGLTRNRCLQLAPPWTSGTGALANLLRGTLADRPDMLIPRRKLPRPGRGPRIGGLL